MWGTKKKTQYRPGVVHGGAEGAPAVANQIPTATNGLADATVPASEPEWDLVLPQSKGNPWQASVTGGSGTVLQQDFNVQCAEFGKIQNILLNMQATAVAADGTTQLIPSPYWVDHIDFFLPDMTIVETLRADQIWVETCSLQTDQEVLTMAPLYNQNTTNPAYDFAPALSTGSNKIDNWMSLNYSFLVGSQPYLRGFGDGYIKIRVYYATDIVGAGTKLTSLTNFEPYLWVQEAVLSPEVEAALDSLHASSSGAVYNSMVRDQISLNLTAGLAGSTQIIQLQGFNCQSAGIYFQFKDGTTPADCLSRVQVAAMYLQDAGGKQITQNFSDEMIEAIIAPQVVPVSSYFINSNSTTYIFPFCTNIARCIDSGRKLGSYSLTGNERVVITIGSTPFTSGMLLNVISWSYASIIVKRNAAKLNKPGAGGRV